MDQPPAAPRRPVDLDPQDPVHVELTSVTCVHVEDVNVLVTGAVHAGWDSTAFHTQGCLNLAGRDRDFYVHIAQASLEYLIGCARMIPGTAAVRHTVQGRITQDVRARDTQASVPVS